MSDITNQNNVGTQTPKDLENSLTALIHDAEKINSELKSVSEETNKSVEEINSRVVEITANLDAKFLELEEFGKKMGDEFDALLLKHAEDLASE